MNTKEFTRQELYDLVWTIPAMQIAKDFGLTYEEFKKFCKYYDIPLPDGGYWMKVKWNKPVIKSAFNPHFEGESKIVLAQYIEEFINNSKDPLKSKIAEIENDPKAPLIFPVKIIKPDILTIQTREYWKESKGNIFYDKYKKLHFPIRVGDNHQERGLRFMDAFTKLLRYRGHTIAKEYHNTCVLIDGVYIDFDLREASKRIPATTQYGTSEYVPTGEFIFKIGKYSRVKEWRDGKEKLESLLAKIVAKLEIYAEQEKIEREHSRIWRLQYEEERKRKEDLQKLKEEEMAKFKNLVTLSERYNKSQLIRQYIHAEILKVKKNDSFSDEFQKWVNWAKDKADWYDPTIEKDDEILDN